MSCPRCLSTSTSKRKHRTSLGYRTFFCRDCGRRFNERTGSAGYGNNKAEPLPEMDSGYAFCVLGGDGGESNSPSRPKPGCFLYKNCSGCTAAKAPHSIGE